jgi:hypothetical protein
LHFLGRACGHLCGTQLCPKARFLALRLRGSIQNGFGIGRGCLRCPHGVKLRLQALRSFSDSTGSLQLSLDLSRGRLRTARQLQLSLHARSLSCGLPSSVELTARSIQVCLHTCRSCSRLELSLHLSSLRGG